MATEVGRVSVLSRRQVWCRPLVTVCGFFLMLTLPVRVCADIYTWVDERGVQNFVDDPTIIPERFRVQARLIVASDPSPGSPPPVAPTAAASSSYAESPVPSHRQSQGTLAVALAERLGLATGPTPEQAAIVLLERGILPPAGWILDEPIDPGGMTDLAHSLLAASSGGQIVQSPETALRTLEGVAAEMGVALVAFELPPPPQPTVIAASPQAVIIEQVFVPAFPIHHRRFFQHPNFQKRFSTAHRHFQTRFSKDRVSGERQTHQTGDHHRQSTHRNVVKIPQVGRDQFHGGQGHRRISHHPRPDSTASAWRTGR